MNKAPDPREQVMSTVSVEMKNSSGQPMVNRVVGWVDIASLLTISVIRCTSMPNASGASMPAVACIASNPPIAAYLMPKGRSEE
ncbi:hypothetical protein [Robbsia andropogonis]|uniref:hypothetical protein n=1 Tax=Robbsia andropogonis TaxID=28092 RepID=UPI0034504C43